MSDPRVVTAELGGREWNFVLKAWSLYLAQRTHGFNLSNLEVAPDKVEAQGFASMLEILWIAALRDNPELTIEEFGMQIGFDEIEAMADIAIKVMEASGDTVKEALDSKKKSTESTSTK